MSSLVVDDVSFGYGPTPVLDGLDLEVEAGRLTAVLGPSGCGKTTLLRLLAGFLRPDGGSIELGDTTVASRSAHVPTERRRVGLVPQEGALYPHLTVAGNIGFGLRRRDADRRDRVAELLALTGLEGLGDRYPREISGGQQQRVALARALAPRPAFVLLDEPFSALDAKLREDLRTDVKVMLRSEETTAILVTHDQAEAMAIGDSIALMRDGRIVQHGVPYDLYHRPVDTGVARFLGESLILPADEVDDGWARTVLGRIPVAGAGTSVLLRPDQLSVRSDGVEAKVRAVEFRGAYSKVVAELADGSSAIAHASVPVSEGDVIGLAVTGSGWLLNDDDQVPTEPASQ